jgi:phage-related tail fiber protein
MIKQTGDEHAPARDEAAAMASAVTISLRLAPEAAAAVDRWAARRQISRVAAAEQLLQFGLDVALSASQVRPMRTARATELAASQIGHLIDPDAPSAERDRRIERLTKGPPEFVDARVDLPKPKG